MRRGGELFACLGKAVAIVHSNANFGSITKARCATNAVLTEEASAAASFVALVTVCYSTGFGGKLPFIHCGNPNRGAPVEQASVALARNLTRERAAERSN